MWPPPKLTEVTRNFSIDFNGHWIGPTILRIQNVWHAQKTGGQIYN